MDQLQQERDDFERFIRKEGFHPALLKRDAKGYYINEQTRSIWFGWIARAPIKEKDHA
jgi:hypothetical protein